MTLKLTQFCFAINSIAFILLLLSGCALDEITERISTPKEQKKVIAFPSAEGFGSRTPGGRGGKIIEVTNLNDDGFGSFRQACYSKGPRIIVFRVAGIIELKSDIKLGEPFITIGGQTAPGGGVGIKNATLRICTHDVIVRFIRFRVGDGVTGTEPFNCDALKIEGSNVHNIIVDHCSMSWAIDENVSTWGTPHDITIQWCIISEALNRSKHPKGAHSMGVIFGDRSTRISFHHNLLAHNGWRNPLVHNRSINVAEYDIKNNVIYNYGKFCSVIRGNIHLNYIGNYITAGPNSVAEQEIHIDRDMVGNSYPKVYIKGNRGLNSLSVERYDWQMVLNTTGYGEEELRVREPFLFATVNTQLAKEAYETVLKSAGAIKPKRDTVDSRIILDVKHRTGKIIDSQREVGGWPQYKSGEFTSDSDHF